MPEGSDTAGRARGTAEGGAPLPRIVAWMRAASRIVVLTGAGMSAESGIPVFRGGRNGLWSRFDPMALATADAFRRDRALVWAWYRWRIGLVEQASPNDGHRALATLARLRPDTVVVTQNVDDLHERGGSPAVVHLHGSLFECRCFACRRPHPHEPVPRAEIDDPPRRLEPPICRHCGGPIRPGVVWFGESLPEPPWNRAVDAVDAADLLVVVGTSGLVHPAAGLPLRAKHAGTPVVEIGPQPTALTPDVDLHWPETAARGLPPIVDALAGDAIDRARL